MWKKEGIFSKIPEMNYSGVEVGEAKEFGNQNYVLNVDNTTKLQYEDYIHVLINDGFVKHSDNGPEGMEGLIHTTNLMKDNITLTVSYLAEHAKTHLSASYDLELSEYLNYNPASVEGINKNAKTKLHMTELNCLGSSFIIQLKNGHFVVEDGGLPMDGPYLLDYLESLVPEEEKPIIEGWFISHVHGDHFGALMEIVSDKKYTDRIYVEGIYLTVPSEESFQQMEPRAWSDLVRYANGICNYGSFLRRTDGEKTKFHRMIIGQRYYFCDIAIDVAFTLEQCETCDKYQLTMNDTSTCLMHHIEGQRVLNTGDSAQNELWHLLQYYEDDYFDVDIYTTPHHAINIYNWFTEHIKVKTVLYTHWRIGSLWWPETHMTEEEKHMMADWPRERSKWAEAMESVEGNAFLKKCAQEYYSRGEGTVVMTFPYTIGSAEIEDPVNWKYNSNNPGSPNRTLYTGLQQE